MVVFTTGIRIKIEQGKMSKWYPSSQRCHCCGKIHPEMKDLNIRTMKCNCGCNIDRVYNAALNIKAKGLRQIAV